VTDLDQIDEPFRLLDLPPELWIYIAELAVTDDDDAVVNLGLSRKADFVLSEAKQPDITRVCKALRKEALPHFYRCNKFFVEKSDKVEFGRFAHLLTAEDDEYVSWSVEDVSGLTAWLKMIGRANRQYLTLHMATISIMDVTIKLFGAYGAEATETPISGMADHHDFEYKLTFKR